MREIIGARLQGFAAPGSMGVVRDTRYVRCFWPKLDRPTALFAAGSSGIEVEGPPTPRNVIFPSDTRFTSGTRRDCFFLRHIEAVPLPNGKHRYDEYVAELTAKEAADLREGRVDETLLRASKEFRHVSDGSALIKVNL